LTTGRAVSWSLIGRWEWLLIEVLVLGLAVAELVAVRRSQRRDHEAKAAREMTPPPKS
jgi:hypothetical protein